MSLIKVGQFLLKGLKISNANNLGGLTSIVHLLIFSKEFHNLKNNNSGKTLMVFSDVFNFTYRFSKAEVLYKWTMIKICIKEVVY